MFLSGPGMRICMAIHNRCTLKCQLFECSTSSETLLCATTTLLLFCLIVQCISGRLISGIPESPFHVMRLALPPRPDIDDVVLQIKNGLLNTTPFDPGHLIPPFHRYTENFEISAKYKLSICTIPKIMSTFNTALICFLKNPAKFRANGRRISKEKWATSFCFNRFLHRNYTANELQLGTTRIAFTREPIDRFLSGFVNKCILKTAHETESCFGCGSDLSCFVERFRNQLWDVIRGKTTHRMLITNVLAPQTWFCNYKDHIHDYFFIRYGNHSSSAENMVLKITFALRNAGVPRNLVSEITSSMLDGKSHHSTYSSNYRQEAARQLYSNHTLLKMVLEMYFYDFVVFDYPIPNVSSAVLSKTDL